MRLQPVTLKEAKRFVARHHRHNRPPVGWLFGVGLSVGGELVGVAIAGRPVAAGLDAEPTNVEITRVAVHNVKNGNSRLYGAITRAAAALGYLTAYTYTLATESGVSLKAAGFVIDAELPERETWNCKVRSRTQQDMFGEERRPAGPKIRWKKELRP